MLQDRSTTTRASAVQLQSPKSFLFKVVALRKAEMVAMAPTQAVLEVAALEVAAQTAAAAPAATALMAAAPPVTIAPMTVAPMTVPRMALARQLESRPLELLALPQLVLQVILWSLLLLLSSRPLFRCCSQSVPLLCMYYKLRA
jgi:hypothetical protein